MTDKMKVVPEDFQVMLQVVASGKETAQDKIQLPLVAVAVSEVLVVVMVQIQEVVLEQAAELAERQGGMNRAQILEMIQHIGTNFPMMGGAVTQGDFSLSARARNLPSRPGRLRPQPAGEVRRGQPPSRLGRAENPTEPPALRPC